MPAIAPTPPSPPPAASSPGALAGVRRGLADNIRAVGQGLNQGYDFAAIANDHVMIVPVEGINAAGQGIRMATENIPVVRKVGNVASKVTGGIGFVSGFYNLMVDGLLKAPGTLAAGVTGAIADRISPPQSAPSAGTSGAITGSVLTAPQARLTPAEQGALQDAMIGMVSVPTP